MADINILVDSSQVRSAKQELQDLGNSFYSASKSASVFMQAFERAAKQSQRDEQYIRQVSQALQKLINDNLKITNAYKSAEESASAFTEELRKQEAQALKTAKANQDAFNRQLGITGPSATEGGAGASAMEAEIERLRQKYDQIYAASQMYERSLQELNMAHMLGVTSIKQHEAAVEALNAEYQAFQNGVATVGNRFTQHVNQSASGMNQFGVVVQQAGYQVGDFLVQVQSGTNWMVAFGQQATQLVGVLPMMTGFMGLSTGALVALSAGLGIAIPLVTAIGAAWMRSTEESDKATSSIDKQAQAYQTLIDRISELQVKRQMEASGLQTSEEQLVQNEINRLLEERAVIQDRLNQLKTVGSRAAGYAQEKQDQKELLQLELDRNQAAIEALQYEQQLATAAKRRANEQRNSLREARDEAESFRDVLLESLGVISQISATDLSRPFLNAIPAAQGLISTLQSMPFFGQLYGQAVGQQNLFDRLTSGEDERGSQRETVAGSRTVMPEQPWLDTSGGGGGGGPTEDALQRLREQVALENELLGVSEAQARVIQALGQDRSKYSQEEIAAITAEIEAYNQKLAVLEQQQQIADTIKSSMEDAFMSIVTGTESVADAFKNMAYLIIQELYKVLVVQQLVGSFEAGGGGILGSLFGSFGARASGGSIMPNQPYLVGEHGPELVIPRHSGTVVNANQTANAMGGSGGVTVQNNISVTGSDAAMVRAEVTKMIPQITNATKAAVIDARLRGGQMKAAFQ